MDPTSIFQDKWYIICIPLLERQKKSFLQNIVSFDKKWVLYNTNRSTSKDFLKNQSKTTPKPSLTSKVVFKVCWNCKGRIYY